MLFYDTLTMSAYECEKLIEMLADDAKESAKRVSMFQGNYEEKNTLKLYKEMVDYLAKKVARLTFTLNLERQTKTS